MLQCITPQTIANEVMMLRSATDVPVILVEGPTDTRLYKNFFMPPPQVRTIACQGKSTLLGAMRLLNSHMVMGVLGICDADFDRLLQLEPPDNVALTDHHDAEIMIAHSDCFHRIYEEIARTSIEKQSISRTVRDRVVGVAAQIGNLRLWCLQNPQKFGFKDINPGDYIRNDLSFDLGLYLQALLDNSPQCTAQVAEMTAICSAPVAEQQLAELARGHDFSSILDALTATQYGRTPLGVQIIETMLRLGFDISAFLATTLAGKIRDWENGIDVKVLLETPN